jgi:hypothetical protein
MPAARGAIGHLPQQGAQVLLQTVAVRGDAQEVPVALPVGTKEREQLGVAALGQGR